MLLSQQGQAARALKIVKQGAMQTDSPHVKLAFVEMVVSENAPDPEDLRLCREWLEEIDRQTQGKSERVKDLIRQSRQLTPAPSR